ncbi:MAG: RICIN domain-containing protein [Clostridiales bacterium]|jgi:cell division septation protein DedD|nr:RICIN domain-containing protein [Clostridiales bacterium]
MGRKAERKKERKTGTRRGRFFAALFLIFTMVLSLAQIRGFAAETVENAIFPMAYLNLSQGYGSNGTYSHKNGYAMDNTGKGSDAEDVFAPFTGTIKKLYASVNGVWLESANKVRWADGTIDYMTVLFMHDNDISNLKVGQKISQGQVFYQEGVKAPPESKVTGTHLHIECGKGKFSGSGWYKVKGMDDWVINNAVPPQNALSVYSQKTTVGKTKGYTFKTVDSLLYSGTDDPEVKGDHLNSSKTQTVSDGVYIIRNVGTGKVLNINTPPGDANGAKATIWGADGSPEQQFRLEHDGGGKFYFYSMKSSAGKGRILNIYKDSGNAVAGDRLTLYDKLAGDPQNHQRFYVEPVENGQYVIESVSMADCVFAPSGTSDNAQIVIANYNKSDKNQLWYLESAGATPTPTPVPEPTPTPTPSPAATPTPELPTPTPPVQEPTPTPEQPLDASPTPSPGGGIAEGEIRLGAEVTRVGVKFTWSPSNNALGYRIYRSTSEGGEGLSISDFPITSGGEFVDVNVNESTQYYYTIRAVKAEARFDPATLELIGEDLGPAGAPLAVETVEIVTDPESDRRFIMMRIDETMMNVNGEMTEIDPGRGTTPVVINGRTMVPIRAIVETMGGTVGWDDGESKITLAAYENVIEMWLDKKDLFVNGSPGEMDIAPTTVNERTMLPVRFAAENLGCEIEWIGSSQQIIIVYYA